MNRNVVRIALAAAAVTATVAGGAHLAAPAGAQARTDSVSPYSRELRRPTLGRRPWASYARLDPNLTVASRDPCALATAAATLTLGEGQPSVQSVSPGAGYASSACAHHVVDINVTPQAARPGGGYSSDFSAGGFAADVPGFGGGGPSLTQAQCESLEIHDQVYRRPAGAGSFVPVGGGTTRGSWASGPFQGCMLRTTVGYRQVPRFQPPAAGTDTYRVAVSVKLNGAPRAAGALASHTQVIR